MNRDASVPAIEKAYKAFVLQNHADKRTSNDPEEKKVADDLIRRATEARDTLLDKDKRALYDLCGKNGLKQMAQRSEQGESFREALASVQLQTVMAVAEPHGTISMGVNASDLAKFVIRGRPYKPFWPEVSSFSVQHEFQQPLSERDTLLFYGQTGKSVHVGPSFRQGQLAYQAPRPGAGGLGVQLTHRLGKNDSGEHASAGLHTDGRTVTLGASVFKELDPLTSMSVNAQLDLVKGAPSCSATVRRQLWMPEQNATQVTAFGTADMSVTSLSVTAGVTAVSAKHVTLRAALVLSGMHTEGGHVVAPHAPEVQLSWKRRSGPELVVAVGEHVSVGYSVCRAIDRHSQVRLGSTLGTNGIFWTFDYRRAKQRISLPVQVADEWPSLPWIAGLFAAPLILDYVFQRVFLAGVRRRRLAAARAQLREGLARARMEQRFQRADAEQSRHLEWEANGIVVLQARYGRHTEHPAPIVEDDEHLPTWIAVETVLQQRVHHERDHSRLVMAEDFCKVPGFFDLAPGESKELSVHYLYRCEYHHAVYEDGDTLVLPQADHREPQVDWRRAAWDWPVTEPSAEGSAGVD